MTESLVERLRRLNKEATPGKWYLQANVYPYNRMILTGHDTELANGSQIQLQSNAALIVAMRNALPGLLRLVELARDVSDHVLSEDEETVFREDMHALHSAVAALDAPEAQT